MDLARRVLDRYAGLSEARRVAFFAHLAKEMEVDPAAIELALAD